MDWSVYGYRSMVIGLWLSVMGRGYMGWCATCWWGITSWGLLSYLHGACWGQQICRTEFGSRKSWQTGTHFGQCGKGGQNFPLRSVYSSIEGLGTRLLVLFPLSPFIPVSIILQFLTIRYSATLSFPFSSCQYLLYIPHVLYDASCFMRCMPMMQAGLVQASLELGICRTRTEYPDCNWVPIDKKASTRAAIGVFFFHLIHDPACSWDHKSR